MDLIEVRAPYCALRDVQAVQPGRVSALVIPEQSVDLELGEIAAAEAGRHMAILGSVACATHRRDRERRSYYLAERAVLRSSESLGAASKMSPLRLDAHCVQSGRRQARAECEIRRGDGTLLFGLDVTYKLVPEKIFQRLFAAFRVDMRRTVRTAGAASEPVEYLRKNPYRQRLQLTVAELDRQRIRCEVPSVSVEACAGHFPLYPAVPVAVLMEAFSNAGGALLRTHRGAPELRYRVRSADVHASRLVFAGQSIVIHGEVLEDVPDGVAMQMRACLLEGAEVASAKFVLDGVPAGSEPG
ncbi:MAG TPA: hypothetical protein VJV78_44320 [Polyangiales bacterium]|nr:hypothetical protein [Polyangiales bacterium]